MAECLSSRFLICIPSTFFVLSFYSTALRSPSLDSCVFFLCLGSFACFVFIENAFGVRWKLKLLTGFTIGHTQKRAQNAESKNPSNELRCHAVL